MIFLTGATGLIGKALVTSFLEKNFFVKILIRKDEDKNCFPVTDKLSFVVGDILDLDVLISALEGVDFVVHAAGLISFHSIHKNLLHKTNVEGTRNLVDVALTKNIKKFIHFSSVAAIGREVDQETIISEKTPWVNSAVNSEYAVSKYYAELEVWRGVEEGLPAVILNPSVVLGRGELSKGSLRIFHYAKEFKFCPDANLNYVDIRTVVEAVEKLLQNEIVSERFILHSGRISYPEVFQSLREITQSEKKITIINPSKFSFVFRIGELCERLFRMPMLFNLTLYKALTRNYQYANTKSVNELQLQNFTFKETIRYALDVK